MFWRKKESPEIPKQALILKAYLAGIMPLLPNKLTQPTARAGLQVFILGMADMLRQAEKLTWEQFIAVYGLILAENQLLPKMAVDAFVERVGKLASGNSDIEKLMRQGAQSIHLYLVERDAHAPTDLLGAAVFAEKNAASFENIKNA